MTVAYAVRASVKVATPAPRKSAEIATFPKAKLHGSVDDFSRILGQRTKHPDPRIMFLCLGIYQTKTGKAWPIGGGYEIRITQTGAGE